MEATTSSTIFIQKICNEDHFPSKLSLHSILIPTLEEREQEYVKCFEFEVESNDAFQDDVNDWEKDEDHEEVEAYTTATTTTMKCGKECDSSKLPSFKELFMMFINFQEKTEANFNEVRAELKKIGSKIDGLRKLLLDVGNSSNEPYTATMGNETMLDFKKIETFKKDNDKEALIDDPPNATVVHVFSHQVSPNIFKRRREVKKSYLLQHPFIDPTKKRKLLMTKTDIASSIFDPLRPPSMEAKMAYTQNINDGIEEEFEVNIEYMEVDQKWFQKIMLPGEWLSDSHIDAILYFFRKRRIVNPDVFTQKFTTTDTLFWQKVNGCWRMNQKAWNKYILPKDDILIDYAMGLYPKPSLKWSEVDVIYVPINLRNTHWVLGVVHLRSRKIYIYDSLKSINKPNGLKTLITPLAMLLPRILSAIKYYEENGDPKGDKGWDIEILNNIPQQTKDGDCGMFLIKFVEYLMHNHPMDTLIGERMDWFREKIQWSYFSIKNFLCDPTTVN
ncbi:uncharacterized protein LOC117924483 isoform X3 [Vitis riparia]|uniref:uncharacterized protein LOC117924483 isoform X3 n=1 Tax=Vitis riparia TaxID=96939 RepID=UPI00155A21F4|nr:uncharacterized protein LOC117924483 isoform X3 [Vitis riparia]